MVTDLIHKNSIPGWLAICSVPFLSDLINSIRTPPSKNAISAVKNHFYICILFFVNPSIENQKR